MANFLKTRAKASMKGRPQGIAQLVITATDDEAAKFKLQNDHLSSKGLPFYVQHVMLGGMVWLWAQKSWEQADFITHLQISHAKPGHRLNRADKIKEIYTEIGMEDSIEIIKHAKGKIDLELWVVRQEGRTKGVLDYPRLSYTHSRTSDTPSRDKLPLISYK